MHETWAEDVTLCLRERLAIITFIAISVQTASRPYLNISICTLRGDLRKTGALHGEFDIWIRRRATRVLRSSLGQDEAQLESTPASATWTDLGVFQHHHGSHLSLRGRWSRMVSLLNGSLTRRAFRIALLSDS
jgi:hypothetical protein